MPPLGVFGIPAAADHATGAVQLTADRLVRATERPAGADGLWPGLARTLRSVRALVFLAPKNVERGRRSCSNRVDCVKCGAGDRSLRMKGTLLVQEIWGGLRLVPS